MHPMEWRSAAALVGRLEERRAVAREPLNHWFFSEGVYNGDGTTAPYGARRPIAPGTAWNADVAFFDADVRVPGAMIGKELWLEFNNEGEGLLRIDGSIVQGLDPRRHTSFLGRKGDFHAQVESTRRWQESAMSRQSGQEYPAQIFRGAALLVIDPQINEVCALLRTMLDAGGEFCETWLNTARLRIRPDLPPGALHEACEAFLAEMAPALERNRSAKKDVWLAVGHSHLDLAYLWPLRETRRKMTRTFANQLALLDAHESYTFAQSQAVVYEWARRLAPDLYGRIVERVKQGRWEPVGGMYVEPDANIPSAESLIRQFLYGMQIFRDAFGECPQVGWLPDTFGLSAALPQILRGCGVPYLYTAKLRNNNYYKFPYTNFWWEGIDGSRVITHLAPVGYSGQMTCADFRQAEKRPDACTDPCRQGFYAVGHGDGGGGATEEMLNAAEAYSSLPGLPLIRWESARRFFRELDTCADSLPTWCGEMYYDIHQGTYTSQAALKRLNRRLEDGLRLAEILDVISGGVHEELLRDLGKTLLLNQFHDILPGSLCGDAAREAREQLSDALRRVTALSREMLGDAVDSGAKNAYTAFNPSSFPRSEWIQTDAGEIFAGDISPLSAKTFWVSSPDESAPPRAVPASCSFAGERAVLENALILAEFSCATGDLLRLYDRDQERELLQAPAGLVQYDEIFEFYEAWNLHHETLRHPSPVHTPASVRLDGSNPNCAALIIERSLSKTSRIRQRVNLRGQSRRLDFETDVYWSETGRVLRYEIPTTLHAAAARYDLSYGNIERAVADSTEFVRSQKEVCARRWFDLSESGIGLAVLNDCKHGCSVHGGKMGLTLLKSPKYPDPDADMGEHSFAFSLYVHEGDFRAGRVHEEAERLNEPLPVVPGALRAPFAAPIAVNGKGVYIGALKMAHDGSGDCIIRLYENHGGTARVRLTFETIDAPALYPCDMLEAPEEKALPNDKITLRPYEICTLRMKRRARPTQ